MRQYICSLPCIYESAPHLMKLISWRPSNYILAHTIFDAAVVSCVAKERADDRVIAVLFNVDWCRQTLIRIDDDKVSRDVDVVSKNNVVRDMRNAQPSDDCSNQRENYDEKLFAMEKLIYFHRGRESFGSPLVGNINVIKVMLVPFGAMVQHFSGWPRNLLAIYLAFMRRFNASENLSQIKFYCFKIGVCVSVWNWHDVRNE